MISIYNVGIFLYSVLVKIASVKSKKARLWIDGRNRQSIHFQNIDKQRVWFHIASLGEYEQAKPLLAKFASNYQVVITFFSPSGFELKKTNPFTDEVFYLPIDSAKNATNWIEQCNPVMAVFVKYDLWYHYLNELDEKKIPTILISSVFRDSDRFFSGTGNRFFRTFLLKISYIYCQNHESVEVLKKNGITHCMYIGDTRVDSVLENKIDPRIDKIKKLFHKDKILLLGSSYAAEENLIQQVLREKCWSGKMIIAPHSVEKQRISDLKTEFKVEAILLSELNFDQNAESPQVLIVDSVGLLKSMYSIADVAFIGGGFGKSLHNTLEPAVFGIPIIFGPDYQKFIESVEMAKRGGAFPISNFTQLKKLLFAFSDEEYSKKIGAINRSYLEENKGATRLCVNDLKSRFSIKI